MTAVLRLIAECRQRGADLAAALSRIDELEQDAVLDEPIESTKAIVRLTNALAQAQTDLAAHKAALADVLERAAKIAFEQIAYPFDAATAAANIRRLAPPDATAYAKVMEAKENVVKAALSFDKCAAEFEGDLTACREYLDALYSAIDKYRTALAAIGSG